MWKFTDCKSARKPRAARGAAPGGGEGGSDLSLVQAFFFGNPDWWYSAQTPKSGVTLMDCVVEGDGALGYGFVGKAQGLDIEGCRIQDTHEFGIIASGSSDVRIVGNHLEYIGVDRPASGEWPDEASEWRNVNAIRVYDTEDTVVAGNSIKVSGGTSIQLRAWNGDVERVSIDGNRVEASGHASIEVLRGNNASAGIIQDVTIRDNTVLGPASSPDSRGHPGIFVGNKKAETTFKVMDVTITDNTVSYLAPYETFDEAGGYTTPAWSDGSGTLNVEKGKGAPSGVNYHSGIELSQNGTGVDGATVARNTIEYFPVAGVFVQGSRGVDVEDNQIRWSGWGRDNNDTIWWNSKAAAVALDNSVDIAITGNVVTDHAAGGKDNDGFAPFAIDGANIVVDGNTIESPTASVSGATHWASISGASPNSFVLAGTAYRYAAEIGANAIDGIDNGDEFIVAGTVDLTSVLGAKAYAGFTGAAGGFVNAQDIESWAFLASEAPITDTLMI